MTMLTLTTGTAFIMWLGEQITDRGIGNGMSLIIFAGIVVGLPSAINQIYEKVSTSEWTVLHLIVILAMMIAVVAFIILVERGQRRITVQYAKRVVGRRVMGGQSTHLPLRVNTGGVIPVIFASSFLTFPQTFESGGLCRVTVRTCQRHADCDSGSSPLYFRAVYVADYFLLLLLHFDHFQSERSGGQHAQVRRVYSRYPSRKHTAEYMNSILTRITVVGGLYLASCR